MDGKRSQRSLSEFLEMIQEGSYMDPSKNADITADGILSVLGELDRAVASLDPKDDRSVRNTINMVNTIISGEKGNASGAFICAAKATLDDDDFSVLDRTLRDHDIVPFSKAPSKDARIKEICKTTMELRGEYDRFRYNGNRLGTGKIKEPSMVSSETFSYCRGTFEYFDKWAGEKGAATVLVAMAIIAKDKGIKPLSGGSPSKHKDFAVGYEAAAKWKFGL